VVGLSSLRAAILRARPPPPPPPPPASPAARAAAARPQTPARPAPPRPQSRWRGRRPGGRASMTDEGGGRGKRVRGSAPPAAGRFFPLPSSPFGTRAHKTRRPGTGSSAAGPPSRRSWLKVGETGAAASVFFLKDAPPPLSDPAVSAPHSTRDGSASSRLGGGGTVMGRRGGEEEGRECGEGASAPPHPLSPNSAARAHTRLHARLRGGLPGARESRPGGRPRGRGASAAPPHPRY